MRARHWIIGLSFLPFLLQLLGWAKTPLGGGLCGALGPLDPFSAQALYAQLFFLGMALQIAFAFFLILIDLGLMAERNPAVPRVYRSGVWLNSGILALFLLTRSLGLPFLTPLGWLQGDTAPLDGVSALMAACSFVLVGLLWPGSSSTRPVVR
ncbi:MULTISPECIES: hypothetical protein [unclassified Meiothermus]|uniref:hypothetical protein n=1 Tax=unclassified Meiothermus TaxID=370471 RepID=UPI00157FA7AD|nr:MULTISPECIES: hypothetical protein [unclassified Meiothermus]